MVSGKQARLSVDLVKGEDLEQFTKDSSKEESRTKEHTRP